MDGYNRKEINPMVITMACGYSITGKRSLSKTWHKINLFFILGWIKVMRARACVEHWHGKVWERRL